MSYEVDRGLSLTGEPKRTPGNTGPSGARVMDSQVILLAIERAAKVRAAVMNFFH